MSRTYFLHSFFGLRLLFAVLAPIFLPIVEVAGAITVFAINQISTGAEHIWRELRDLGRNAFRVIQRLKPVYRESYDTNGLSLHLRC
ncbi:hypothetical protein LH464_17415 [Neorhizobium sp. T786]|uniref:hypothetical protein n=1 Tax=Pseudorhizobium xiangyangii TaxID=2883104 RepID=UPI001CFFF7D2|nr:hypothetical protein [Neorhizobium xiangyangii]MCB5204248.1 hypothetical protein [Neorhizobium xiangyangii]